MKISVITINLNNIEGLRRTVQSVVGQCFQDFEYILIDGGSTDGSKEYISSIDRINYWISEPDKGIYNAMNKAIAVAEGDYCIFMNSGDTFFDNQVLEKVAPRLQGKDFYIGEPIFVKGKKQWREQLPEVMSIDFLLFCSPSHQSTFTRTQVLKESPYNEHHKIVSDWEKFFKEWLLHDRSYEWLNMIISYFYMDGISNTNKDLDAIERKEVIDAIIPQSYYEKFRIKWFSEEGNLGQFEKKFRNSLSLPPLRRDWKILRNAFKLLIRDIVKQ